MDRAFTSEEINPYAGDFIFVNATQEIANQFKATGAPLIIVVDPDQEVVLRAGVGSGEAVAKALAEAKEKYGPKIVDWKTDAATASAGKHLLIVGFDKGKGAAFKLLENPAVAKFHDRMGFVLFPYERGSALNSKWKVLTAPTMLIFDVSGKSPSPTPLAKVQGELKLSAVRKAMREALAKVKGKQPAKAASAEAPAPSGRP